MDKFTPLMLSPKDVQVDSHTNPRYMSIHLKYSKTDPFGWGTTLVVGVTSNPLSPVTAMLAYLAYCPSTLGPLFLFANGETLSQDHLIQGL